MTRRAIVLSVVITLIVVIVSVVSLLLVARSRFESAEPLKFVANTALRNNADQTAAVIPALFGMESPRTILVLFLNNTEIRPGGGFIGSYGVITVDKGSITSLFTDGTENLDRAAIALAPIEPPQPLKDHLIHRWFFRDSNWSPDFFESTKNVLKFYDIEKGQQADAIQTVVGITPEVLETIMKYTGPVTARGKVYTSENVTDTLEQAVEIDFHEQGISKLERKAIIGEIGSEIIARMKRISPLQWPGLLNDVQNLIDERHVIFYDKDPKIQKTLDELGWSGRMKKAKTDSFMFVDANLASLKTDRVMERSVQYRVYKDSASGEWRARMTMDYKNTGSFDWRTTRYGTYTRWFFPAGTKFLSGSGSVKSHKDKAPGTWDVLNEEGQVSIGSFIVTEPGTTTRVVIDVGLAPHVVAAITSGQYELLVQKQLGTHGFELTVDAEFGKSVRAATPPEDPKKFGDNAYTWKGFVKKDVQFDVSM